MQTNKRKARRDFRAFWLSFYLTMMLFITAAGLITVDYRCRMMVSPPEGEAAALPLDEGDAGRRLTFRWFSQEGMLPLSLSESQQDFFEAFPALLPPILRELLLD